MAKKYNNFGVFAAKKRAKLKAEREQAEAEKLAKMKPRNEKKKAPNLDWTPMDNKKIKMPKYPINWSDESTDKHSTELVKGFKKEKYKLLCMPPGTGKTAVAIETIGKMQLEQGKKIPLIITAPPKVIQGLGWHKTIFNWNQDNPDNTIEPLLIVSIDRFKAASEHGKTYVELIKKLGDNGMIILDEVQKYKNPTGKRAKQLQKFGNFKKLGLSATPLTNDVIMDSASYLIMGGYYKNKTAFMNESGLNDWLGMFNQLMVYNKDGSIDRLKWPYYDVLLELWSNVLYRPNIDMSTLDMPDVKQHIIQLPFSEQLNADMRSLNKAYRDRMFDSFSDFFMEYVERLHSEENRINELIKIVKDENNKQPLIFYHNIVVKDIIVEKLKEHGFDYQVIDGEHNFGELDHDNLSPILIQYKSGSEGIELKNSNCTIYYQNQTSYDVLEQARGRNRRRGMKDDDGNVVTINQYYLIAEDNIDQELFNRVSNREEISEGMLEDIVDIATGAKKAKK